ncbi:hypothetical protein ACFOMD_04210 [Sphingoaurantiacus capsulatus]|uniref:Uncharacterized protein n=1 Tax=Sphingoaurantiacus capsulatus TaxID=1771310 RepID=A0ABV7X6J7_9SPHN
MNRALITAPAAFLISATMIFATAAPAAAAERCAAVPTQVRAAAATADASAAKQALRFASVGEKLCEAGNDRAANKKFEAAFAALGIDGEQQLALLKK